MHRYIDVFFTVLGVFVVSFVICGLLTAKFAVKLTVSFLISVAAVCTIACIMKRAKRKSPDYRSFVTYCVLSDESETADLLHKAGFIADPVPDDGFYPTNDGAACLYVRFSKPSRDHIVTLYKKCVKKGIGKLTVWCAEYERAGVAVACTLPDVEIKFRTLKPLYKKARKAGLLAGGKVKSSQKRSVKTLLPVVLSTRNSYRFAFSSLILFALSFLTPLRIYYITVAAIVLVIAVIARIYGEKYDGSA